MEKLVTDNLANWTGGRTRGVTACMQAESRLGLIFLDFFCIMGGLFGPFMKEKSIPTLPYLTYLKSNQLARSLATIICESKTGQKRCRNELFSSSPLQTTNQFCQRYKNQMSTHISNIQSHKQLRIINLWMMRLRY